MGTKLKVSALASPRTQLRILAWFYIVLIILEGAMRKWLVPSLSDPLLFIREPIVLAAYGIALASNRFPVNRYVVSGALLVGLSALLAFFVGHGNAAVTLFGIRTNYLHFPFAFIIGSVFNRNDVITMGKWWLWGTIGMTAIIVLQFSSPQSAWINLSVGGAEGAGFSGALGRYRPPGTFSFIVGVVWFYTFSAAFALSGITQHRSYPKLLLALSVAAIFVAVPVSISRMLFLTTGFTCVTALFITTTQKGSFLRIARLLIVAAVAVFIVSRLPIFDNALEAFAARWENSTGEESGGVKEAIVGRIIQGFSGAFGEERNLPLFGYGLGAGTQAGQKLLSGESKFQLGEDEWWRVVAELGIPLGMLFILWRIAIAVRLFRAALSALFRNGNGLPLLIFSATAFNLVAGQIGQTTIYGFTIIGIGLCIASLRQGKTLAGTSRSSKAIRTKAPQGDNMPSAAAPAGDPSP